MLPGCRDLASDRRSKRSAGPLRRGLIGPLAFRSEINLLCAGSVSSGSRDLCRSVATSRRRSVGRDDAVTRRVCYRTHPTHIRRRWLCPSDHAPGMICDRGLGTGRVETRFTVTAADDRWWPCVHDGKDVIAAGTSAVYAAHRQDLRFRQHRGSGRRAPPGDPRRVATGRPSGREAIGC